MSGLPAHTPHRSPAPPYLDNNFAPRNASVERDINCALRIIMKTGLTVTADSLWQIDMAALVMTGRHFWLWMTQTRWAVSWSSAWWWWWCENWPRLDHSNYPPSASNILHLRINQNQISPAGKTNCTYQNWRWDQNIILNKHTIIHTRHGTVWSEVLWGNNQVLGSRFHN